MAIPLILITLLLLITFVSSWYAFTLHHRLHRDTIRSKKNVSDLLHDLRNPLSTALLNIEEIRDQIVDAELAKAMKDTWNSVRLINRFIETGGQKTRREPLVGWFSPAEEIELAIFSLQSKANQRQVDVRFRAIDSPQLHGEAVKFYQIISNVISNAIDAYLNYPVSHPFVSVILEEKAESAVITVIDYGSGIEKNMRTKIFTRGFTTKSSLDGSGLGLSIVKEAVADLGGSISLESEPGLGTTFEVRIPLKVTSDAVRSLDFRA